MKFLLLVSLCLSWCSLAMGESTNAWNSVLEKNRRGLAKQIEQARNAHNDTLVTQLLALQESLDHYQTAENDPNRGTVILYDPRSDQYARIPATALIASDAARARWKANLPDKARGLPVSFSQLSKRLSDVVVLIPVTYDRDNRGFVVPRIDPKAASLLSQEPMPRLGIIVDPVTHDALGGVPKP